MTSDVGWFIDIGLAVILSFLIGGERAYFQKAAGIRTHTLVGLGAAVFTVVSKYGFIDVATGVAGDGGSRVAAQIVSGIGFLGAGLIFVRSGSVRGLTTAASIWLVAAVGMAAGSGLWSVAIGVTVIYFVVTLGIRPIARHMPHARATYQSVTVVYEDGHGILRTIMETIGAHGVQVANLSVAEHTAPNLQRVVIEVNGSDTAVGDLLSDLRRVKGIKDLSTDWHDDGEN